MTSSPRQMPRQTSPRTRSSLLRARTWVLTLGLLAVLPLLVGGVAWGGADDFEFGKKLAASRYFEYARKVFQQMLDDPNRSDEEKGEARYGMALLRKEEAIAACGSADAMYDDIVKMFDSAAEDIAAFVAKNPKNTNVTQAKLDVGGIRLNFVQWARELLKDEAALQEEEFVKRGFSANKLADDARRSVDQAISYFDGLRPKAGNNNPKPYEELASHYFVISQYFRALVEPPCSPAAVAALKKAGNDLEEYIMDHDGQLFAIYAQDIYGLVWWELARCSDDPEKKLDYYNKAFEWFETCIYTEDEGPEHLRIITRGYYHLGQAGMDAGSMPERNFARDALIHLETMLDQHPTAWRLDNGLRALIELSKLECARGNANKAVEVAQMAADRAKKAVQPILERAANRQLNEYVSGSCGGTVGGLDPEVLRRVADDLFSRQKLAEAIRAYRAVIESTDTNAEDFVAYRWHAWRRMAQAYGRLGDRLGEALAYEPIHDAWKRGLIPTTKGDATDQNMIEAGNNRRKTQAALKELADQTGSAVLAKAHKDVGQDFLREYPEHPSRKVGEWKAAIEKWREAKDQKAANNPTWRKTLTEARKHFKNVAKDPQHERSDAAYVYLVRADFMEGKYEEAVAGATKAFAYWDSPEAIKQAEQFETVRGRRESARSQCAYWLAAALAKLSRHQEVADTLAPYHERYPGAVVPYPSLAYDLLAQAHLALGNIDSADRVYRLLLRRDPKYPSLPRITQDLAGHYNQKRAVINTELVKVTNQLNAAKRNFKEADRKTFRLSALVQDLRSQLKKADQAIEWYEEDEKLGKPQNERRVDPVTYREKLAIKKELDVRVPAEEARLKEWAPKRAQYLAEMTRLETTQAALSQQLYDPLVKAANYWREWDDTLKKNELDRDPRNVAIFATMFYNAAKLRPDEPGNWEAARELFEDYLSFPEVERLKLTDETKRGVIARLGDVYANLAERAEDPDTRRDLVTKAVDLMQESLADKPADKELVVGMLSDKILVLKIRLRGKRWRFAINRPATVKELRDQVHLLGKVEQGGRPHPTFEDDDERKQYLRALDEFRNILNDTDDSKLQSYVGQSGKSAFDPVLYKELADSSWEFRLALAWAYSETGRDDDVPKAVNLALSLVAPPLGVEEDTPVWWQARAIQLKVYLDAAERKLTGGTSTSAATQWLVRAGKVFEGIAANYPDLGETAVPGSQKKWRLILDRMNRLRGRASPPLSPIVVKISQARAPEGGEGESEGNAEEAPSEEPAPPDDE